MRARAGAGKLGVRFVPTEIARDDRMTRALELVAAAVLGAGLALAGAHWLGGPTPLAQASRDRDKALDVGVSAEKLRDALEREATQREMLAAEVEFMRSVLERIAAAQVSASEAREEAGAVADTRTSEPPTAGGVQFEEERLARLGMPEDEIADLRERWDRAQLAKLELDDRAVRDGSLMHPGHRQATNKIDLDLRADIGEEAYDKLLYATNLFNRTEVKQVLGGSAAARAGLQPGDHLISYAGARIFKPADLRFGTAIGTRDERVRLVVGRDGESFSVIVPRGPLGVLVTALSSPPR